MSLLACLLAYLLACFPSAQIASSSGDGKILFWSLRNNLEYPLQGYMLTPPVKRKGDVKAKKVLVGGESACCVFTSAPAACATD